MERYKLLCLRGSSSQEVQRLPSRSRSRSVKLPRHGNKRTASKVRGWLMLRSALVLSGQQVLSGERIVMPATLNNLKEWGKPFMALRMHPLCRVLASCAFYCG